MVTLVGAGVSEKVSGDFAAFIKRSPSSVLQQQLRGGISDARTAFIRATLRARALGTAPPSIAGFQERRGITSPQVSVAEVRERKRISEQLQADPQAGLIEGIEKPKPSLLQKTGRFLSSQVRIPIFGGTGASVGIGQIKEAAVEVLPPAQIPIFGFPGASIKTKLPLQTVLAVVPETPAGFVILGTGTTLATSGSVFVRGGVTTLFGLGGVRTALDPEAPLPTRLAGGFVAVGAGVGAVSSFAKVGTKGVGFIRKQPASDLTFEPTGQLVRGKVMKFGELTKADIPSFEPTTTRFRSDIKSIRETTTQIPFVEPVGLKVRERISGISFRGIGKGEIPSFEPVGRRLRSDLFELAKEKTITFEPLDFGVSEKISGISLKGIRTGKPPSFEPVGARFRRDILELREGEVPIFEPVDFGVSERISGISFRGIGKGEIPSFEPVGRRLRSDLFELRRGETPIFEPLDFGVSERISGISFRGIKFPKDLIEPVGRKTRRDILDFRDVRFKQPDVFIFPKETGLSKIGIPEGFRELSVFKTIPTKKAKPITPLSKTFAPRVDSQLISFKTPLRQIVQLRRFEAERKPKPFEGISFEFTPEFVSQLKVKLQKPKPPKKIPRAREPKPSFTFEEIKPPTARDFGVQQVRGRRQQQLLKPPKQIQKQIQKQEFKVFEIPAPRQIVRQRILQRQRFFPVLKQKDGQLQLQLQKQAEGISFAQTQRLAQPQLLRQQQLFGQPQAIAQAQLQLQRQSIRQLTIQKLALEPLSIIKPRVIRDRRGKRKKPKIKKKVEKRKGAIRVSFTGIVLGIKEAAFVDPRFGILPGQIRGLETRDVF
ncbi:MAG TPA: hypothetical protein ENH99_03265 [Candidatus Pacearchaeota archaeon]|nr:hypothetical protein [Candidatus Pacearchaeota archaeon]